MASTTNKHALCPYPVPYFLEVARVYYLDLKGVPPSNPAGDLYQSESSPPQVRITLSCGQSGFLPHCVIPPFRDGETLPAAYPALGLAGLALAIARARSGYNMKIPRPFDFARVLGTPFGSMFLSQIPRNSRTPNHRRPASYNQAFGNAMWAAIEDRRPIMAQRSAAHAAAQRPVASVVQPASAGQTGIQQPARPPSYFHHQQPGSGQTPTVVQGQGSYNGGSVRQPPAARTTTNVRTEPNTNTTGYTRSGLSQEYRSIYDIDEEVCRLETRLAELKTIQAAAKKSTTESAPTANVNTALQSQLGPSTAEQPKPSDKGKQRAGSPPKPVPQAEDEQKSESMETTADSLDSHEINESATDVVSVVASTN